MVIYARISTEQQITFSNGSILQILLVLIILSFHDEDDELIQRVYGQGMMTEKHTAPSPRS